jgi:transposase
VVMKVYSEEFKADAVALYVSDPTRTYASVAKDLGVNRETLRLWVRQARQSKPGEQAPDRRREADAGPVASDAVLEDENRQLRKKVRELEAERDILRRAAKYFAGETNW